MINVLVITPYPGLAELIKELNHQLNDFSITVEHGDLQMGLSSLEKYEEVEFDFIISRGGTANILRENTTIPVLDLEISGYDVLRIILLLKGFENSKIAVIGFKNVIQNFQAVSELMDMNIKYIELQNKDVVEDILVKAKKEGIDVVVGDTITNKVANDIGLQGILITSGKESILQTFHDVRFLHNELKKIKEKTNVYENAIHLSNDGVIIFNDKGLIKFANKLFYSIVGASLETEIGDSIYEILPFIPGLLSLANTNDSVIFQLTNNNHENLYSIYIESFVENEDYYYLLKLKDISNSPIINDGIKVTVALTTYPETPKYLFKNKSYHHIFRQMTQFIHTKQAFCLIGEKGTGKRLLIDTLDNQHAYSVELNIYKLSTKSFNLLLKLLDDMNPKTIIHLSGFENLTDAQQIRLEDKLTENKHIFILTFTGSENSLQQTDLKLTNSLKEYLINHQIYIPNLRDLTDDIETFIQSFIVKYNERYGKQVVGITDSALEVLKQYPWPNNLIELRSIIHDTYKILDGSIIKNEVITILNKKKKNNFLSFASPVNLQQSLVNIEKDIIRTIMEEEDFNQTKVAERLEINRSTLWRKLKDIERSD